jgi:hypothetical protein
MEVTTVAMHTGVGPGGGQPGIRGLGRPAAEVSLTEMREGGSSTCQWPEGAAVAHEASATWEGGGGPRGIGDLREGDGGDVMRQIWAVWLEWGRAGPGRERMWS